MVGLGWFPRVAVQSYPLPISGNTTREPLAWFPFWQSRESPFFVSLPPFSNTDSQTHLQKKKTPLFYFYKIKGVKMTNSFVLLFTL